MFFGCIGNVVFVFYDFDIEKIWFGVYFRYFWVVCLLGFLDVCG